MINSLMALNSGRSAVSVHSNKTASAVEMTAPLFEACPLLDRVFALPRGDCEAWLAQIERPYDAVICARWDVDHWLARRFALIVRAPVRIGFDRRGPPGRATGQILARQ